MTETLLRHWNVLRAAWSLDVESARTRRRHIEIEFLPPALEVIETPGSPLGRAVLWALIALLGVAAAWAWFGRLDVVAVAPGRVVPMEQVKRVQASELSVVQTLLVREGQTVTRGQTLLELDATEADASEAQAKRGLLAAGVDRARARAIKAYLDEGELRWVPPADTPPEMIAVQQRMLSTRIEEHESVIAALHRQRGERQAEYEAARTEQAKLRETLDLLEGQLRARRELVATGFMSSAQLFEMEERRIERARSIQVQDKAAERAVAAMASLDQQIRQARAEFASRAAQELAEAEDNLALRSEEVSKTERRTTLQTITAPVSGVVQGLQIHTVGAVVEPAQELMKIVPASGKDSASRLVVEAIVSNKDVGSIRVGQEVRIKVDAFPFTRHGVLSGRVEHIGADAVQHDQAGSVFVARIGLVARQALDPVLRVSPGFTVQAEVMTGRRRIIEYLWSPVALRLDEAGREQ